MFHYTRRATPTTKSKVRGIDKRMISPPTDFRHIAHVDAKTPTEIENIKFSDDVVEAVNENHYYIRPTSVNNTIRSRQEEKKISLDSAFPSVEKDPNDSQIRHYENKPTSHVYQNMVCRPSTKKYQAPPPPPQELKPKIIVDDDEPTGSVVFRQRSADQRVIEIEKPAEISTPMHIDAPKQNSVVIERPGELGCFAFGLDDCIPVSKKSSPMSTLSPIMRQIPIQDNDQVKETPILGTSSPENNGDYMTIRSTSVQGTKILDDLDSWLDNLEEDERMTLRTLSTDESGYPTLVSKHDRDFMQRLIEKYNMDIDPQTIRLPRKKDSGVEVVNKRSSISNSSFLPLSDRPVSLPIHPNRPPPDYDAPSFDAPTLSKQAGRLLSKQNAFDLRSTASSCSYEIPKPVGTISSDITDFSTTSSRYSDTKSFPLLSSTDCLDNLENIEEEVLPPVPKPRTKKLVEDDKAEVSKEIATAEAINEDSKEDSDSDSEDEISITRF